MVKTPGYHVYLLKQNGQEAYLYNRSHLIGYQLTGLNNDARNLVTGTHAMNAIHEQGKQASMETYIKALCSLSSDPIISKR